MNSPFSLENKPLFLYALPFSLTEFMMKWIASYLTLALLFLTSHLVAQETLQYDCMKVAKIDVTLENNTSDQGFNPKVILASLQTKVGNLFSQTELDADLKALAVAYDRIEPSIDVVNGELYISLKLWIKPTIASITFCGNSRIKTKKLIAEMESECGEVFERDQFINDLNKIKFLYARKGYFEADIRYAVTEIAGTCQIDIEIIIDEGRAGRIQKIEFVGLNRCEENDILELMISRKYNFFLSWYTGKGCYHPEMVEHDKMIILDYLQNEGYADAQVEICLDDTRYKNKVVLVISVDKGQCYRFGKIRFCGNTLFCDEEIWDQFEFATGYAYSPDALRETAKSIRDLYGMSGYIEASTDVQLSLRDSCPVYDVSITIDEGEQYSIGMVRIFGNSCTQTRVILHESLLCPGDVFDIRRLAGTEKRLANTGYFSDVNVYAVKTIDDEYNTRDVFIEVDETDTGNLGLFFGFSSLENIFGGIDITERNFNLLGLASVFPCGMRSLRGAGEYLHFKTNIGNRETAYLLQWTKPYFLDTPWILGIDLEKTNNRLLSRGYELKTYGGNIHMTYIMNDYLKYDFHYRAEHSSIEIADKSNTFLDMERNITGFISAIGPAFIYDSTDSPRCPTSGFRSRFLYELAGIGGNFQFMKFAYLNTYYYPLHKNGVLKFRADLQFIHTYGHTRPRTLPLSERLFLGGETTVRGYRNFIIGPLFGNNEPEGGVSSYLLSEEYQYNLLDLPRIDAFAFVDAGYVSLQEFTFGRHVASVGFGLRAEVMKNMPITIGLGYPIHPSERRHGENFDRTQRFFFSMGGCF